MHLVPEAEVPQQCEDGVERDHNSQHGGVDDCGHFRLEVCGKFVVER